MSQGKNGIDAYREIVGEKIIQEIHSKAERLARKHILHINSTYQGGGVAEILNSIVPLMNDIGIKTGWRILAGYQDFFTITKKFHNGLQGEQVHISEVKKRTYLRTNESFAKFTHIDHDLIFVHDPQPLPLIRYYEKKQPWIWQCHIDISNPNQELWNYLQTFILKYDLVIVSDEKYKRPSLPVQQRVVSPSIDPLTTKNFELSPETIKKMLNKFKIPTDKPIITQISRFDKWKDPEGVIKVFEQVSKKVDCRLVLLGNLATDDPEGLEIYNKLTQIVGKTQSIRLILTDNQMLVNALQRAASVVIQKSTKEGFGLTVTEALWKSKPVVASNVGGIPLQVIDGKTGYILEPNDISGFADRIVTLLQNHVLASQLGSAGKLHIKNHFLVTRHILDYLNLQIELLQ